MLSLAKSVGTERAEIGSLVTQLEEAKKEIEVKEASLKAMQGECVQSISCLHVYEMYMYVCMTRKL